ncbi:MAG: polyisoprenoid-binding protein [Pseudomonadales bacterium]|nr:polyisoprenoid-binding protein [Pseudomonadales bacterium]
MCLYRIVLPVLLFLHVGVATAAINVPSGRYDLEKTHAYITFSYSHLGFSRPHLSFNKFEATLIMDADAPAKSSLRVVVDPSSIDSRVDEFNDRLRGENFFDTANFPEIVFESTAVEMTSDATAIVSGNLTIKGVTRAVTLQATLNKADMHPMVKIPAMGFSATGKVIRSEFGLGAYVPMVGDEVEMFLAVEFVKVP